ncbi:MAG: hypothetical protein IJ894_17415, partial [Bacteroidales bacterium]|nr:hypothetical protein [Bacteroidales bacterium]
MEITILILLILAVIVLIINTVTTRHTIHELRSDIDRLENVTREEFDTSRRDRSTAESQQRLENNELFRMLSEQLGRNVDALAQSQKIQLQLFSTRLKELQELSKTKMEEIRHLVDDKLKQTLETRFNESFKLI